MTKQEAIKSILYRFADELAAVLAEDARGSPKNMSISELARYKGKCRQTISKQVREMEEQHQSGVFRDGNRVTVNLEEYERWVKNGKELIKRHT